MLRKIGGLMVFLMVCGSVVAERAVVKLTALGGGFTEVTDIQAVPGETALLAVCSKEGDLMWLDTGTGRKGVWVTLPVESYLEQGLLGLAFHPNFSVNRQFVLNYSITKSGHMFSRVELWRFDTAPEWKANKPRPVRVIMDVAQPYANHNAGQLAFGPDGYLYIGWGDGGSGGDPHGNGQNTKTFLGSMLRVDVNATSGKIPYAIPKDNPFIDNKKFLPEIWAWGFRNPWRYSFDSAGRLWVADVGQNAWEEISVVERGKNYGWNIMEGKHCFLPRTNCNREGLQEPVHEYGHDLGNAITGGYDYRGKRIHALKGKYIFGDFVSGRIWALDIEAAIQSRTEQMDLGKFPISISTFGRDADGEILVGGFRDGTVYRLDPHENEAGNPAH